MVKILMYHSIGEDAPKETRAQVYCVTLKRFREQIEYVSGFASLRVTGLNTQTHKHANTQTISVTFDDGLLDNFTNAYPVLKELGLKAYFFILAGRVGAKGYMGWQEICELRDAGMIIGSHGMTHRILIGLSDVELDYELKESKRILEEKLRQKIECFSIPRGFYNRKIIEIAKKAGYTQVFTSNPKDNGKMGQTLKSSISPYFPNDRFKLGRIAVKADWDLEYFARVLEKGLPFTHAAKELVKNASKRLLGAKNYDRLRAKVLRNKVK